MIGKGPGCCDSLNNNKERQEVSFMHVYQQGNKAVDLTTNMDTYRFGSCQFLFRWFVDNHRTWTCNDETGLVVIDLSRKVLDYFVLLLEKGASWFAKRHLFAQLRKDGSRTIGVERIAGCLKR